MVIFYFTKFTSQDMLAALLVDNDLAAFKYMKELTVEDHDDVKSGFKISLVCLCLLIYALTWKLMFIHKKFDPNPFFKNEVLSKEFRYDKEGNLTVIPTKIEWKEGKVCSLSLFNENRNIYTRGDLYPPFTSFSFHPLILSQRT